MNSHRQIFRSSAIIGGASAITMIIGIIKVKVLAVLLGAAGVGLMGMYQNLLQLASTMAGCGLQQSGVRQVAAATSEEATLAIVRRTLWLSNLMLGLTGMVVLWLLREPVAQLVFDDAARAGEVGWLGLGVLLTLIAGSQMALLQGLRRIGDLARVNIIGGVAGASAGVLAIYLLGEGGILWFVLTAPAVSILVALYYTARLPRPQKMHDWETLRDQWQVMFKLGIPLMAAALLTLGAQLIARSLILHDLGIDAAGYFQAAWSISMIYIGFVLNAMAADYFPRLTKIINDHERAGELVNQQTEMALLLAGPVLLGMLTMAPWVVQLLYAESFAPASELLRWQILGDILKILTWPMGFIVLAKGRGGIFILTQLSWNAVYLLCLWLGLEQIGLLAAGVGFFIAYLAGSFVARFVGGRLIGFKAANRNLWLAMVLLTIAGFIIYLSGISTTISYVVGLTAMCLVTVYSFHRLDRLVDIRGWLGRKTGRNYY